MIGYTTSSSAITAEGWDIFRLIVGKSCIAENATHLIMANALNLRQPNACCAIQRRIQPFIKDAREFRQKRQG